MDSWPGRRGSVRPVAGLDIQPAIFDSKSDFALQRYKSRKSPLTILAADRYLSAKNSIAKADLRWLAIFPKLKKKKMIPILLYHILYLLSTRSFSWAAQNIKKRQSRHSVSWIHIHSSRGAFGAVFGQGVAHPLLRYGALLLTSSSTSRRTRH